MCVLVVLAPALSFRAGVSLKALFFGVQVPKNQRLCEMLAGKGTNLNPRMHPKP